MPRAYIRKIKNLKYFKDILFPNYGIIIIKTVIHVDPFHQEEYFKESQFLAGLNNGTDPGINNE